MASRYTSNQRYAMIAAVSVPERSSLFGKIERTGRKERGLTEPGLYRLYQLGVLTLHYKADGLGKKITGGVLTPYGIKVARELAGARREQIANQEAGTP